MGRIGRFANWTLRRQIISYFFLIMLMSIIATIITWALLALLFSFTFSNSSVKPANYFENQIPDIVSFVHKQENILDIENKDAVEKMIPLEGMDYQVINKKGQIMYGSMTKPYISTEMDLINSLHTNIHDGGKFIKYYPIFDESKSLIGAIGFRYELSVISANPVSPYPILIGSGIAIAFFSPFFYFFLFSFLMGKSFSRKIEHPFNEIIEGAHKIENHDLDFSLSHIRSTKELNKLVSAFEEMKEALKDSLQKQWKLEQDRSEMVAAVAHDLKTPLTIIQGHVEGLLEMKTENPKRLEQYLQTIQASCQRSIRLIYELNDVSKIEQPEFKLEMKETDIRSLVLSKINEYNLLCKSKNITLKAIIDDTSVDTVYFWIDPFRINQVLDNILTNSLKYSPSNGEIKWKTTITEHEVIFEIMDNGQGFLPENKSKIFEKFFREDSSRTSEDGHSGLGLFIAQTIVKKHNGEIIAKNIKEGGANFKVLIKNMRE
ncbi:sensor histidine kinase [Bacillus sp. JJ722]|uniref:sensor histidine kinase n=1 Tax=Bacillus sp. JJ722 TaxID=3122973 RepID=UPI002FFD5840